MDSASVRAARWVAGGILTGMLLVCAAALKVQYQVETMRDAALAGPDALLPHMRTLLAEPSASLAPRAALYRALAVGKVSWATGNIVRRAEWMAAARADLAEASAARPVWAEATVVRHYLDTLEYGPLGRPTVRGFVQSYRDAPYMAEAAEWRLGYAERIWARIDRDTRAAVVREGIWYGNRSGESSQRVAALLGDSEPGRLVRAGRERFRAVTGVGEPSTVVIGTRAY